MSRKKEVDRGGQERLLLNGEKRGEGQEAIVTETGTEQKCTEWKREHERDAFNGTAERRSLLTVAHLCCRRDTLRETGKRNRGRKDGDRGLKSGGVDVLKLGPLYSSTKESLERDNGLEGVIKREREERRRREQENDDNVGFPAVWHSRNRDND